MYGPGKSGRTEGRALQQAPAFQAGVHDQQFDPANRVLSYCTYDVLTRILQEREAHPQLAQIEPIGKSLEGCVLSGNTFFRI